MSYGINLSSRAFGFRYFLKQKRLPDVFLLKTLWSLWCLILAQEHNFYKGSLDNASSYMSNSKALGRTGLEKRCLKFFLLGSMPSSLNNYERASYKNIPVKFGKNPRRGFRGDVIESKCWRRTTDGSKHGRRTEGHSNSLPPSELKLSYISNGSNTWNPEKQKYNTNIPVGRNKLK